MRRKILLKVKYGNIFKNVSTSDTLLLRIDLRAWVLVFGVSVTCLPPLKDLVPNTPIKYPTT